MIVFAATCLTGCGDNSDYNAKDGQATLTITYAKMGYGDTWLKEICKNYNEKTGVGFKLNSRIGSDGVGAINTEIESKASNHKP